MYNGPFDYLYNRPNVDEINNRIQELERIKAQVQQPMQQPTNLTQNFSLAPTSTELIRYVNGIDEVQKVFVIGDTPYFSKDLSTLWIKNAKGEIKTYEIKEIVKKDEKDLKIEQLMDEIRALKEGKNNEYSTNDDEITTNVSSNSRANAKSSKK